ncbi:MFS transporter [Couchioplanes caeruleus]|uniref:MFS transporter n=2 Tax=Couchioplanes caeruleus TaxID=56438 RepID=A0A1K0GRJ1_9ACTN|nr:MFS transporter [Couchioplanes caeruleus]OJF15022.1 MFS transporter [Couchioplanes caeruleus subsp. caeruleus]ROP28935.1 putative MFS family arabinose efflux permease [Couchioplanes caeruleus]
MSAVPTVPPGTHDRAATQRRILSVLVASQILSGAGLAAGITVGALLAQDMLGGTGLAGLPSALFTAGSALASVVVGRLSQARGRRPGLVLGYLTGAVGSAGVIVAAVAGSAVLLFPALFLYGAGTAANLQARYAGADLADRTHRSRAVSTVLVATTVGGVVGPNLAPVAGDLARTLGIPHLAGPFLLSGTAYALAALALTRWLRPDPLLLARSLATAEPGSGRTAEPHSPGGGPGRVMVGAAIMVLTQVVMVGIMTMTPIHMHDHGLGIAASGLVIAVHVAAMYLPSPVTGWLVDRFGSRPIAAAGAVTLLAAGIVAAAAPGGSIPALGLALGLLGAGWNLGIVSGTAIVTDALPLETRARTQGLVDVAIALAGATGGMTSGVVVATASYSVLATAGGVFALALLPVIAAGAARR